MDKNKIIVFLIILTLVITYNVILGGQNFCIKLKVDMPYQDAKRRVEELFFTCFTCNAQVEYEDKDFVILGGRNILLPAKGKGINIQGYLKETDDCCVLILAYPALPLESY